MKVIQETTEWKYPNHIYFVNDSRDKMFAYIQNGNVTVKEFKVPISFSTSKRKFKEIANVWNFRPKNAELPAGRSWTVTGSKGSEYTVTEERGQLSCSCPGFKYHGKCKHAVLP